MKPLLALTFLAVALPAAAAGGFSLQAGGDGDGIGRLTINRLFGPVALASFGDAAAAPGRRRYSLALHPEVGVSAWRGTHGHALQLSAVPMLRLDMPSRWFVEAGVGLAYFTNTGFAAKDVTTRLQFADHLGVGWHLADEQALGLRLSHFSNFGLKEPNPGVNAVQLSYSRGF